MGTYSQVQHLTAVIENLAIGRLSINYSTIASRGFQ